MDLGNNAGYWNIGITGASSVTNRIAISSSSNKFMADLTIDEKYSCYF